MTDAVRLADRPLVFLDVETTGASPTVGARITEIGALRVEQGKVVATFKQLLNPEMHVPPFISNMTGIYDDMLWDAPLFHGIKDDLELFLDGAIFVAHNVNFDYQFIRAEFARVGHAFAADRFCTARLSRKLYPKQPRHNLDTILQTHNIMVKDRHRAFDDAQALFEFYKIAERQYGQKLHQTVASLLAAA